MASWTVVPLRGRPIAGRTEENPLLALLREAEPWAHRRVAVPDLTRQVLRTLVPLQLAWAIVLASILTGALDCGGRLCGVATLDRHPTPLLVAAVVAVLLLIGTGVSTRAFVRANRRESIALTVAVMASLAALLGVAAVLFAMAAVAATFVTFFSALTLEP